MVSPGAALSRRALLVFGSARRFRAARYWFLDRRGAFAPRVIGFWIGAALSRRALLVFGLAVCLVQIRCS